MVPYQNYYNIFIVSLEIRFCSKKWCLLLFIVQNDGTLSILFYHRNQFHFLFQFIQASTKFSPLSEWIGWFTATVECYTWLLKSDLVSIQSISNDGQFAQAYRYSTVLWRLLLKLVSHVFSKTIDYQTTCLLHSERAVIKICCLIWLQILQYRSGASSK